MARQCSSCVYCRCIHPALNLAHSSSRNKYYCVNPELRIYPISAFVGKEFGYIGRGDLTPEGRLTIKTHPRWCPMELFSNKYAQR